MDENIYMMQIGNRVIVDPQLWGWHIDRSDANISYPDVNHRNFHIIKPALAKRVLPTESPDKLINFIDKNFNRNIVIALDT